MAIVTYALGAPIPDSCRAGVPTIGNFDGVHLGHQALLAEAARQARVLKGPAVAVTFDPHPSQILRPDRIGPPLTTFEDRTALVTQHGADHVLVLQTSPALLQLGATEFFDEIIVKQLRAKALVEGFNFGFGRNREGTVELLKQLCTDKKIGLSLIPPQAVLGQPVSSSRVRCELLAGNVEISAQLLGRPYHIVGVVAPGQKRGATLGFPTANLEEIATLVPGNGVYAVRASLDGTAWPAAANVGPNPTFGENARKIEVHLIGFNGSIYGRRLTIDFVKKIRDTKPFANAAELVAQIGRDIDSAKQWLQV